MMNIKNIFFFKKNTVTELKDTIFSEAASFADDMYATQLARTHQYQLYLLLLCGLSLVLGLGIIFLLPLKETQLVVVHQSNDGVVWVEPPITTAAKVTPAQTESEIVNYVTNRESYSAFSYEYQYKLVNLLSNNEVSKSYINEQNINNPMSPITKLAEHGTRRVTIESVVFLDSENQNKLKHANLETEHKNLAQVNFQVETKSATFQNKIPYIATLTWEYRGSPTDPVAKWQNWDGFTVTHYTVTRKNAAAV